VELAPGVDAEMERALQKAVHYTEAKLKES
jgi:hypothetical protein